MMTRRPAPLPSETTHVLARVAIAVQDSLDTPWTIASMAALAGYEEHYFAHAFAEALGQPPLRYVRGLRLERAAHDLVFAPDRSIQRVGQEAGYASYEAFRRAFVRAFGFSPGVVRKRAPRRLRGRPAVTEGGRIERPGSCLGGPWIEKLGPLRGVSLLTASFSDQAIASAWRRFPALLPPCKPRTLGAAVSPWGWLAPSLRPREYRCLALGHLPPSPELTRWTLPAAWQARFDFHGPTSEIHTLFAWIFGEWLPHSTLRCTFAPMVTLFDERAWHESRYAVSRAQVYLPVRQAACD
jgi:AraC-like DNA-binding protein